MLKLFLCYLVYVKCNHSPVTNLFEEGKRLAFCRTEKRPAYFILTQHSKLHIFQLVHGRMQTMCSISGVWLDSKIAVLVVF